MNIIASFKAPAKLNIFLKILKRIKGGANDGYHELSSRFVRFDGLYDELRIIERIDTSGLMYANDIADNLIFKAYSELENAGFKEALARFFSDKQIHLLKGIPSGAGLGGGSSDVASFLLFMQEILGFEDKLLMSISAKIGSDVSFFASKASSANVRGFGQIVESFDDDLPRLGIVLSKIFCSTPEVYKAYAKGSFIKDTKLAKRPESMSSKEILSSYENFELNDLLAPVVAIYAGFSIKESEFLSGSGSAKFKVIA